VTLLLCDTHLLLFLWLIWHGMLHQSILGKEVEDAELKLSG
jgi:hypothetical protein